MVRGVVVALALCAAQSFAEEAVAPPPSASSVALYAVSASLVSLASLGVSGVAGAAVPLLAFDAGGRPQPIAVAGGIFIAAALHFGIVHLVVPELGRLANVDGFAGTPSAARAEGWRVSSWPAFAALAGLAVLGVGAGVEQVSFSSGQWAMVAGLGLTLVAGVVWTVLDAVFSWSGFVESRKAVSR